MHLYNYIFDEKTVKLLNKILYVEDQKDIQLIAKYALESIGKFELSICNNGQEALEIIETFSPDLILLDVMMPIMDGPTTLEKIKQMDNFKDIPIIFMTAKILPTEINELIESGAAGVISKPFDPVSLSKEIQVIYNKA